MGNHQGAIHKTGPSSDVEFAVRDNQTASKLRAANGHIAFANDPLGSLGREGWGEGPEGPNCTNCMDTA